MNDQHEQQQDQTPQDEVLTCYYHPERETMLRCSRCDKPICTSCAKLTPTGYRCKDCITAQRKKFDTAELQDYVFGVMIASVMAFVGSFVSSLIGFFTILIAPVVGTIIASSIQWVVKNRRSNSLFKIITGAAVFGCMPFFLLSLINFDLYRIIFQGLFIFLCASTLYFRLTGIDLRR